MSKALVLASEVLGRKDNTRLQVYIYQYHTGPLEVYLWHKCDYNRFVCHKDKSKGIELCLYYHSLEGPGPVRVDHSTLMMYLSNLCSAAILETSSSWAVRGLEEAERMLVERRSRGSSSSIVIVLVFAGCWSHNCPSSLICSVFYLHRQQACITG